MKAIRAGRPLPTTEVPPEPSRLVAPAGLFPTAEERAALAAAGAEGGHAMAGARVARESERERAGDAP
jgi:hypothetical protein